MVGKYNVGEVWWTHFPFQEGTQDKHRPAIVIDDDTIAILALYVTSQNKDIPYSIEISDWKEAGLTKPSWARIDRIISISEWNIDQKIGKLSASDLIKIMQLVAEIMTNKYHEFSLVAIKTQEAKYLQIYDERWHNWLFPYFRTSDDNNKENIDKNISNLFQREITTTYVTTAKHCKYSVSDEVYKIYNHKLYMALLRDIPEKMQTDSFELGNNKFLWMSIEQMENDKEIMKQNDDIVAFVKMKC